MIWPQGPGLYMTAGQGAFLDAARGSEARGALAVSGSAVKGVNSFDPWHQGRRGIKVARGSVATVGGVVRREGEGEQHAAAPAIDRAVVSGNGEDVRWAH